MITEIIETDRGTVEYSDAGTGAPVLYFHGTGVTGDAMVPIESRLIDDGFRLVLPNRPGYGNMPEPDDYVLATGEPHSVRDFISEAARCSGIALEWRGTGARTEAMRGRSAKTHRWRKWLRRHDSLC